MRRFSSLVSTLLVSAGLAAAAISPTAPSAAQTSASGRGLDVIFNERGRVSLSSNALGTLASSGTLRIVKPAGATVRRAVLYAATTGFTSYRITDAAPIRVDGVSIPMAHEISSNISSYNYWTDVTGEIRAKVDGAPAGDVNFTITEPATSFVDGTVLSVIFDDPNVTVTRSVALLYGALKTTGDQFQIGLEAPFTVGSDLQMSLGISYGFQGSVQYSTVTVNDQLVTSAAGGQDDGASANGALITVGGVGDSVANPTSPTALPSGARSDDELYDLRPFIPNGATSVLVRTVNPSNDDNVFAAAFSGNPPITSIVTDSSPNWTAWSVGDVHAHASGDTSLLIHPSCGGQDTPIGEAACADLLVPYTARGPARFGTDWIVLTEHAPWLGFQRNAALVVYNSVQGARQWAEVLRVARRVNGNGIGLLGGLELGTSAPACASPTAGALPFIDGPVIDSPGHYGVYETQTFIDDGIFDCSETGSNGYAGDTADAGGFGGVNHPRNKDGGSRWHCWNTADDNGFVQGLEESPIILGSQPCALGIDAYAVADPSASGAFRTIELISGDNLPQKSALSHWDQLLQNRFIVAAVGGGDGHTAPRKQDAANALSCLGRDQFGIAQESAVFACFIDKGGKVKDPSVGKIGGAGRTMVLASRTAALAGGVTDAGHPVRVAMKRGATVATNGPRVLARIGSAQPGDTVGANGGTVRVRVDWQETFRHAGDSISYCESNERVDGKCPNSFRKDTFEDITNGAAFDPAIETAAEPDQIVLVVAPRVPCGRSEKKCQKSVTRIRLTPDSDGTQKITPGELAAHSLTRDVAVPDGDSYVRVEWYSDTGKSNDSNDKYFDDKLWDFGALTSPIFVTGTAGSSDFRSARAVNASPSAGPEPGEAPRVAARTGAVSAAAPSQLGSTLIRVEDLYARPLAGAAVTIRAVDVLGRVTPTGVNGTATPASGTLAVSLPDGDYIATVSRPGCTSASGLPIARTSVFDVSSPDPLTVRLNCGDPDRTPPTVAIASGPEGVITDPDVSFAFTAADNSGQVRTACLLDQVELDHFALEPCVSPISYDSVGSGQHTFQVVAIDPNGNWSPVATRTFFVTTPLTPAPLYRARQVPQGNGAAAPNIVIERNVARAGLGDSDPDGDGWAVLGSTQSANERGYLDGFDIDVSGLPRIIIDYTKPPAGARCYAATVDLSRVTGGLRRLRVLADPVSHPDCFVDAASNALPSGGPIYL